MSETALSPKDQQLENYIIPKFLRAEVSREAKHYTAEAGHHLERLGAPRKATACAQTPGSPLLLLRLPRPLSNRGSARNAQL